MKEFNGSTKVGMANNPSPQSSGSKMSKCKEARRYLPAAVAWILLLSTTSLFFVFPAQWYYEEYSIWILIGEASVALVVIANFTLATFMDPGVIPKATRGEDDNDDLRAPLYKTVDVQGITVRMKWCVTCQFYRPPRCSHCSVCNNCIETFDHHCPWVNNCIGRRNYRFFFMFLMSLSLHMILIFSLCLIYLLQHLEKMSDLRTIISISIMVVITILCVPICGLTGFHVVLVSRGRTTNEQVTGKYRGGYNPFSRGCCYNCWFTLCGPLYPALVRAKRNNGRDVGMAYRSPRGGPDGTGGYYEGTSGNEVKVYVDVGNGSKSKSGAPLSLSSRQAPRDYRQIPGREGGEADLGLQGSQSLDSEPTPPIQRQGSRNNLFVGKEGVREDAMGLSQVRHVRGQFTHGSPHPNRQKSGSRSRTPDSLSSPTDGPSFSSPTIHQKIRAIGGVPTPFTSASPALRRSNPPTPTHPPTNRDFYGAHPPPNNPVPFNPERVEMEMEGNCPAGRPSRLYDSYIAMGYENGGDSRPDPRRFFSETELLYQGQYQEMLNRGVDSSGGPIRELTSSPQRGLYQWKDNSPTSQLAENGNHQLLQKGFYSGTSNPTSPLQESPRGGGSWTTNGRGYYPTHLIMPLSPDSHRLNQPPIHQHLQQQQQDRPLGFVRALEMTESLDKSGGERAQQSNNLRTRPSPGEVKMGKGPPLSLSEVTGGGRPERGSVYDMNYEISV